MKQKNYSRLAVIVSVKDGSCYQVLLSKEQEAAIAAQISFYHGGKLMVSQDKLTALKLEDSK